MTYQARTAAHKARLSLDPRFAQWLDLLAADDPPPDPQAIRRREERDELQRRACLAGIARAEQGQRVDSAWLDWARAFVAATPALNRPLGNGEPA